ncbi:MAG TPA: CdaR family protein [Oscillospiraceae bacterium]|nr:CdaR family protein [Oscillospiraceae bacterium]
MMERILKNNIVLKIIAFLMALLFWAYVTGDNMYENLLTRTYSDVPLAWLNLAEELELVEMPQEVQVVLSGPADVLNNITPLNLKAFVDLRDLAAGQHRLTPTAEVPNKVKVLSFNPQQVVVELEEVESPHMPVVLDVTGAPASGFIRGEARINPSSVFVRGGRTRLNNVDRVRVIVNIDGIARDWSQVVPVQAVDRAGQVVEGIEISPSMVEVFIPISEPQKEVSVKVATVGKPPAGYAVQQIKLDPTTVIIEGSAEYLTTVAELSTETVDLSNLTESTTLNLQLEIPQEVKLLFEGQIKAEIIITAEVD